MTRDLDKVRNYLQPGSELVGSTGGALVGAVIGGLPGAIAGAAIAPALKTVVLDAADRALSLAEKRRGGAALLYATEYIQEVSAEGLKPRTDGWFTKKVSTRSAADEIAEGVLLAAQRTHEENKIRHQGYMLGWLAFTESISRSSANWLIKSAADLSWNQYVMLAIVENAHFRDQLPPVSQGGHGRTWKSWTARQEFTELGFGARGLIGGELPNAELEEHEQRENEASLKFDVRMPPPLELRMDRQRLFNGGVLLHPALHLDRIQKITLANVVTDLRD